MATAIKSLDRITQKFTTVTPQRSGDYEDGVRNPTKDWAQETANAEGSYEAGVQSAITRKSFGKGVKKAGTQKQQQMALTKGVSRWGPGVAVAGDAFKAGFSPYHSAISSATLPPRFAKRDPRNLQRVTAVVNAIIKVKESQAK